MSEFPLDHLSASSVNLFLRCPRQWQEQYIRGIRGPSNSSLVIGSAVHAYLAKKMLGEDPDFDVEWTEQVILHGLEPNIEWRDSPEVSYEVARAMAYHYYELVGKHLDVVNTEVEFSVEIIGVTVPVIGFIDLETKLSGIDYKTTRYFSRNVKLNPEWKLQQGIYQLYHKKPSEIHVLTRAKKNPIVVPDSTDSPLYIGLMDTERVEKIIRDSFCEMEFLLDMYGKDEDWPGRPTHEWAGRYCPLGERCCSLLTP